ncbi:MAG: hypothetical protein ACTHM6_15180 [Tepidisphaeraceae bacterium]
MDKKTYAIGVLSVVAAILLVANIMPMPTTQAATVIKDRDYTLATTRSQLGGEVLYVIDNRTGQVAVVSVVNRQLTPLAIQSLTSLSGK